MTPVSGCRAVDISARHLTFLLPLAGVVSGSHPALLLGGLLRRPAVLRFYALLWYPAEVEHVHYAITLGLLSCSGRCSLAWVPRGGPKYP